ITNVQLSKTQLLTIARIASGAFVKAVSPAGLTVDGDVIVAVSTEDYPLSIKDDNFSMELNSLGLLGEQAILYAIDSAVKQAEGIGGVPSWQDIQRS
ncbi:MAG: P1 family peptidase, partial [Thermodesulfobacteriota bacterium]